MKKEELKQGKRYLWHRTDKDLEVELVDIQMPSENAKEYEAQSLYKFKCKEDGRERITYISLFDITKSLEPMEEITEENGKQTEIKGEENDQESTFSIGDKVYYYPLPEHQLVGWNEGDECEIMEFCSSSHPDDACFCVYNPQANHEVDFTPWDFSRDFSTVGPVPTYKGNVEEEEDGYTNITKVDEPKRELVNHPAHYNHMGMECYDMMIKIWGREAVIQWMRMNAFKYRYRAGYKDDTMQDIQKAKFYEEMALELSSVPTNG